MTEDEIIEIIIREDDDFVNSIDAKNMDIEQIEKIIKEVLYNVKKEIKEEENYQVNIISMKKSFFSKINYFLLFGTVTNIILMLLGANSYVFCLNQLTLLSTNIILKIPIYVGATIMGIRSNIRIINCEDLLKILNKNLSSLDKIKELSIIKDKKINSNSNKYEFKPNNINNSKEYGSVIKKKIKVKNNFDKY